jgi:hypothetical protein
LFGGGGGRWENDRCLVKEMMFEILKAILLIPIVVLLIFGPFVLADYLVGDDFGFLLGLPVVLFFVWVAAQINTHQSLRR